METKLVPYQCLNIQSIHKSDQFICFVIERSSRHCIAKVVRGQPLSESRQNRLQHQDVAKSVTKFAIRESRAQELRNEILNSEKLKAHFDENPRDLDLLKHDKLLSKIAPPVHLCDVPEYLLDRTTQDARKIVKLSRAAMGVDLPKRCHLFNKVLGRSRDPLKSFSAEGRRRSHTFIKRKYVK